MTEFNRLRPANYKLSQQNINCLCQSYLLGFTGRTLAWEYRVSTSTIYYHLHRNNVPTRGRGKSKKTVAKNMLAKSKALTSKATFSKAYAAKVAKAYALIEEAEKLAQI